MPQNLADPEYLAFPFRMNTDGPKMVRRRDYIAQQIEQVLLTNPTERVFELEFGAGVRRMVFEPNRTALWDLAKQRLMASLSEALRGEIDPRSLDVTIAPQDEADKGQPADKTEGDDTLRIRIRYRLATINRTEEHLFVVPEGGAIG